MLDPTTEPDKASKPGNVYVVSNHAKYEDVKGLGLAYVKEVDNLMLSQAQGKIQSGKLLMILGDLTKQFNDMLEAK